MADDRINEALIYNPYIHWDPIGPPYEFVKELDQTSQQQLMLIRLAFVKDVLAAQAKAGLYLVYMGLESGSEQGLKTLHKQIAVEQNIRAVEILKQVGLMFEFGFMLFDPSSTFESVRRT